jgi:hypothetical protein
MVSPNVPECLRHREQWQWLDRVNGAVTSNRTPPQRQLPRTVSFMNWSIPDAVPFADHGNVRP